MEGIVKLLLGIEAIFIGYLVSFGVLNLSDSWIVNGLIALAIATAFYAYMRFAFSIRKSEKKEKNDTNNKDRKP